MYRTLVEVEILSKQPYNLIDLDNLHYDITFGDCSGKIVIKSSTKVSKEEMAKLLISQGSDPSFLLSESEQGE